MITSMACPYRRIIVTILAIWFITTGAQAGEVRDVADMDIQNLLDNIVQSVSKHEEKAADAPANVTVIGRDQIDAYGFTNIADALVLVPGLYVTNDYSLTGIGVRGNSYFGDWNSRVLLLVDGRPVVEQYSGSSGFEVPGVGIEDIDRIEIIKGPSSSLYGSNAFFGMVNLITRKPAEDNISVDTRYTSFMDEKRLNIQLSEHVTPKLTMNSYFGISNRGGSDLFFPEFSNYGDSSLFRLNDDGINQYYISRDDFTGGWSRGLNSLDNISSHTTFHYGNWYLTTHFSSLNTGLAQSLWGSVFNRHENQYRERRHFLDLGYNASIAKNLDLEARISYNYYLWLDHIQYNSFSLEASPEYLPGPLWIDREHNASIGSEVRLHKKFSDRTEMVVGSEVQSHKIGQESGVAALGGDRIENNVIPDKAKTINGQIYNIYTQLDHRLMPWAKVVGGLHFNYFTYTTGKMTPKAALILNPYNHATYKILFSRGFRSPTFYELTFDDSWFYVGNEDLKPEEITNLEVVSSHELPHGLSVDFAVYHSTTDNLIVQATFDSTDAAYPIGGNYNETVSQFRNRGTIKSQGLELSLRRSSAYRLSGFFNLTYEKTQQYEDQQRYDLSNSPRWLANAGLHWFVIPRKLAMSAIVRYIDSRMLWDGSMLNSRTITDFNLGVPSLFGIFNCSLGITNFFDVRYRIPVSEDYSPSTSFEAPRRSIILRLSYSGRS